MRGPALFLVALLVGGCTLTDDGLQPYYPDGLAPTLSGLDVTSEQGNLGGGEVTIQGSGFGTDASKVVVLFGEKNADILEVADTSLRVQVPSGPVTGGPVTVTVATETGYTRLEDAYAYDPGPVYGDDPFGESIYENEVAYVTLQNYRGSAFGEGGWVGYFGVDGYAEFLEFAYPRYHTQNTGVFPTGDQTPADEWVIQRPGQVNFIFGLEDLRLEVSGIHLKNPQNTPYGSVCVDGETLDPLRDCGEADHVLEYPLDTLEFCEEPWQDTRDRHEYRAAWPVDDDFFWSRSDEDLLVDMEIPEVEFANGDSKVTLTLPPRLEMLGVEGFKGQPESWSGNGNLVSLTDCFDDEDDDDRDTSLDDRAIRFEWTPSETVIPVDPESGPVKDAVTYVRVSLTAIAWGWIGPEAYPVRTTIVVPDSQGYVDMPASVLYQIPPIDSSPLLSGGGFGQTRYYDPLDPNFGYVLVTVERITEYRVATAEDNALGLRGDVIVAYVTGDMGIMSFDHPFEQDTTGDCVDNDGDGWVDIADPDCDDDNRADGSDGAEDNYAFGLYTCNDGLDNDLDGFSDADDPDCEDGEDDETNCGDGVDNDGDGWIDDEDGECGTSGMELGEDTWSCADGADSDGDGWVDAEDPDCTTGTDEELGFGATACNDGEDNDGHGDVDGADYYCAVHGPLTDMEAPTMTDGCVNGLDDDGDGFIDANDPDCETGSSYREYQLYFDPAYVPEEAIPTCYDGVDNDGDGWLDAEDPECWAGAVADGFLAGETGIGTTACNDGDDNDGDSAVDAADAECTDAFDDDESE